MLNITLDNPLIRGLACAALQPGLRSILIFNAPEARLPLVASLLAQMLHITTEQQVTRTSLGPTEQEDDLWGYILLPGKDPGILDKKARLFSGESNARSLQLITLPDLTRLSLPVLRACVVLIGADVAHLERNGQDETWIPDQCWLAACNKSKVGRISPHLLDRFALRLWWQDFLQETPLETMRAWVATNTYDSLTSVPLPDTLKEALSRAAQQHVIPTEKATRQVFFYTQTDEAVHPRREIALARLAVALAQLANADALSPEHVDEAATLFKLIEPAEEEEVTDSMDSPDVTPIVQPIGKDNEQAAALPITPAIERSSSAESVEVFTETPSEQEDTVFRPYPEDTAEIEREFAPLRLPLMGASQMRQRKGVVIGVEKADTFDDLSLFHTFLAALPFQALRNPTWQQDGHVVLDADDLRRYKHAPVARRLLLLLLDYTSLRDLPDQDWQKALQPYLQEAYVKRSSICIIQVGIAHPHKQDDVRAEKVIARSILVPVIMHAFEEKRGSATPLAYGLNLAAQTIQHALQHGRSTVQYVLFVVLSDGRGNVPLSVSLSGQPVSLKEPRQGIDEALEQARAIAGFRQVERVFLSPSPRYYPELPFIFAEALSAHLVNIPRLVKEDDSGRVE